MALSQESGPATPTALIHRRFGRVICEGVNCSIGELLDLSAGGMRVLTRAKPPPKGTEVSLLIEGSAGMLPIKARAVWTRKRSWGRQEVGMSFGAVADDVKRALGALARDWAHNEQMVGFRHPTKQA